MPSRQQSSTLPPVKLNVAGRSDIYLRLTSLDDVEELYRFIENNRQHLQAYQEWARDATLDSTRKTIAKMVNNIADHKWLQYRIIAVDEAGAKRLVGSVTFYEYDADKKVAGMGYWLGKDAEGHGYAQSAAERLLQYGFEEWSLERALLEISPDNERSERLAQRLGARLTKLRTAGLLSDDSKNYRVWEIKKP